MAQYMAPMHLQLYCNILIKINITKLPNSSLTIFFSFLIFIMTSLSYNGDEAM